MLGAVGSLGSLCIALHLEPGVGTNLNVPLDRVWVYFGYGFRPPCPKQGL